MSSWASMRATVSYLSTVARELPNLKTHLIGDARAPRLLRHAIFEGVEAGIMV